MLISNLVFLSLSLSDNSEFWADGQPTSTDFCTLLDPASLTWHSVPCTESHQYVCAQIPVTPARRYPTHLARTHCHQPSPLTHAHMGVFLSMCILGAGTRMRTREYWPREFGGSTPFAYTHVCTCVSASKMLFLRAGKEALGEYTR